MKINWAFLSFLRGNEDHCNASRIKISTFNMSALVQKRVSYSVKLGSSLAAVC